MGPKAMTAKHRKMLLQKNAASMPAEKILYGLFLYLQYTLLLLLPLHILLICRKCALLTAEVDLLDHDHIMEMIIVQRGASTVVESTNQDRGERALPPGKTESNDRYRSTVACKIDM